MDLRRPGGYTFTIENKKGDHPMSFGENIARLRARKNWSQEELARALEAQGRHRDAREARVRAAEL